MMLLKSAFFTFVFLIPCLLTILAQSPKNRNTIYQGSFNTPKFGVLITQYSRTKVVDSISFRFSKRSKEPDSLIYRLYNEKSGLPLYEEHVNLMNGIGIGANIKISENAKNRLLILIDDYNPNSHFDAYIFQFPLPEEYQKDFYRFRIEELSIFVGFSALALFTFFKIRPGM